MPEEGDGRRRRTAASRRRGAGPAARHRRPATTRAGAASASGGDAAAGGTAAAYCGAKRQGWAAATARPAIGSRRSIRSVTGSPLRYPRPGRARPGGRRARPLSSPFLSIAAAPYASTSGSPSAPRGSGRAASTLSSDRAASGRGASNGAAVSEESARCSMAGFAASGMPRPNSRLSKRKILPNDTPTAKRDRNRQTP